MTSAIGSWKVKGSSTADGAMCRFASGGVFLPEKGIGPDPGAQRTNIIPLGSEAFIARARFRDDEALRLCLPSPHQGIYGGDRSHRRSDGKAAG